MKFREYNLKELTKDGRGYYGIGASAVDYDSGKYTYLRITDINDDGTMNKNGLRSVDKKDAHKYILNKNDIVFARTGASTGRSYLHDGEIKDLVFAGFLIKFSLDENIVNPKYVKYYCLSKDYKNWIEKIKTGSTRGNVNEKQFGNMPIKLPSLENQNKIVRILSALDKKIEINTKIILNLEQLSSELYKRWFVDFEFPDDEGKPYKSSGGKMIYNKELGIEIPEGWGVGWFDDGVLTKIIKSGINKFSGSKKYVATADVDGTTIKNSTEVSYEDKPSRANMQPLINSVWIAKMQGSVKNIFVAEYMEEYLNNYIFSTGFLGLECLNGSIDYIWNIINSDKFILEKNNLSTGTLMAGINNSTIRNFKYIIPDNKTLRDYGDFTYYINRSIYLYNKNNNLLKEIRDNLIPKLLNGELDLDNIEI